MRAVANGYVVEASAHFVRCGLLRGFDLSICVSRLRGKSSSAAVSKALGKRLRFGKTICLGTYERGAYSYLLHWDTFRIFSMGAVEKPLEPSEVRVFIEHTRSGVNEAMELGKLTHTITSYDDVIRFLETGCNLRVSDVEGPFPLLPLAPEVKPHFMFHWWDLDEGDDADSAAWKLYMHGCANFGAAGMPGTWNKFFVEVLLGVARDRRMFSHLP
eukprot:5481056-Pleurochrysis_carterae.AAC.3